MKAEIQTSCNVLDGLNGLRSYVQDGRYKKEVVTPFEHKPMPGFKCKCGTLCNHPTKIVTETRPKDYYEKDEDGNEVLIGTGFETVTEESLCPRCAAIQRGIIRPEV